MFAESVRATFDLLPDPIFILQPDTLQIVHANQVAEQIMGLGSTNLPYLRLPDLHPEPAQDDIVLSIKTFCETGAHEFEYRAALSPPGCPAYMVAVKLTQTVFDDRDFLLAILRDISDIPSQSAPATEPQDTTILYQSLLAGLSDLMFRITRDGIYRDFHIPETSSLESPPLDAIIGKHVRDVVPAYVADAVMPVINEVVRTGKIGMVEYAIHEAHGLRHYEARFVPSLSDEVIAVTRDITPRKREADRLRDSEKMARALIDASGDSAVLIDRDWTILAINDVGAERLGHSADNMIGTSILDYFPPQTTRTRISYARQLLETKQVVEFDDMRDGRMFHNRASPILDDKGEIDRIAIFAQDITKQRQHKAKLEQQNKLSRGVAEATQRLLTPGKYVPAMQEALAMLGECAEVDRILVFESHPHPESGAPVLTQRYLWENPTLPDHVPTVDFKNESWLDQGFRRWREVFLAEGLIKGPVSQLPEPERAAFQQSGGYVLSLVAAPIFVYGSFWGFVSLDDCHHEREWSTAEINALQTMAASLGSAIARQQVEENLRQEMTFIDTVRRIGNSLALTRKSEDVLEQLLIQIKNVIPYDTASAMLLNDDVAHIVATRGFENFGTVSDSLTHRTFQVRDVPYMQLMLVTHDPYASPDVNGDPLWHELTETAWIQSWLGAPIVFDGKVQGFFALDSVEKGFYTNDYVSQIKYFAQQAAIALKTAHDVAEIEDLEQVKSEIIRIASHDLRTPLTRIRSVVQQLRESSSVDCTPEQLHAFQVVLAATRDMDHIITNILSLERIEAQQRDTQPIYWHDVIDQALDGAHEELNIHEHELTLHIAPDLPVTRGNRFKLERAISNLVHNAIKYTPSGGNISVRAEVRPYGPHDTIAVEVLDNGIGIPLEQQEELFKPFYRGQQSGTEHIPGTGLGLSMTKSVIEEHNGSVYFDSVPGEGSLFGFWVPV